MRRLVLLALVAALPAMAQSPADTSAKPITIGVQTAIRSTILGEERPLMIHLPPSYTARPKAVYPVVYLLDGDAHFAAVSAMADFLARNSRAPEMIVVAIPNTKDRTHDLTPPAAAGVTKLAVSDRDTVTQSFPTAGGAAKLRAFITDELAPWVQSRYRTAPYRILVGHSFGGLFAVDALASTPRAFDAYVAISPSLWWDDGKYVKRAETAIAAAALDGRALYMTTGEREGSSMIDPARELAATLDARHPAGFRSWYRVMPTETHNSNPLRTEYDALERIFAGWEPPDSVTMAAVVKGDVAPLEAYHAALTKRFGIPTAVSPDDINQMAYYHLQQKHLDIALKLFRHNVERSPDYANGWDSLADGLEAQGDLAGAIRSQEKAVAVGEAQQDPALPTFRAHLERLRGAAKR
ncbi:esterase [Gemmatirosa kalamazoonensis]|uniref:Esterase n=1 Tax=Gemmatirosa kalamazoonensis TaxID=861299 RepID=W0RKG3_9BACT|nr:alpha/beta hydrolase-fold protein [Gemmatirosa kalamazoonensis]AHG91241.1 esterase [Gemmatirosa kalamazoonensis]